MTGQAVANVQRIRLLAADGVTAEQIAEELGIGRAYVLALAKQNLINVMLEPPKALQRRNELRKLAAQGLNRQQIAEVLGVSVAYINQTCFKLKIKTVRKLYAGAQRQASPRDMQMAALYRSGKTLVQIGAEYGITRERVRQLLKKYHGISAVDGGAHIAAVENKGKRDADRNAKSLARYGCTYDQYAAIRSLKKPTRAYAQQKKNADARGIGWDLTLWQWWCIWETSGHWAQRGRGQGYCMCRKGDQGPYSVDNVFIAPSRLNSFDGQRKKNGLPIGVRKNKRYAGYTAIRQVNGKKHRLGSFATPEQAYAAYLMVAS